MKKFWQKLKALFVKSDTEKTALQKTAKASIILGCVALIGIIVYFAAVAPLLRAEDDYVPELFDGEVYQNKAIYILRTYERSEIKSVEIKTATEHYKLIAYTQDGTIRFYIEGNEHILLSEEKVSQLLGDVRVLITTSPAGQERVTTTATDADLKNYGLDAASDPAWFEVTLNDGSSYRINIGNALTTSKGYYVTLDGRKNTVTDENGISTEYDIVYALQSGLSSSVLTESAALVSTALAPAYGNNIVNISDFSILRYRGDARGVVVRVGRADEEGISAASQVYKMLYPKSYIINEDDYTGIVLAALSSVTANSIVAYGESIYTPDVYEKFGLDLDQDRLLAVTDRNYALLTFNCADVNDEKYEEKAITLYFSQKFTDLDGSDYYYVCSPAYEVIGKVSAETFGFMEWNIARFTNPYLYYEYFTSVDYIDIISDRDGIDLRFTISGKERTRHVDVTKSGENGEIVYRQTANGAMIPLVYDTVYKRNAAGYMEYEGEFEIFRDLYYVLITRMLALYADIDETMTTAGDTPVRRLRIKTAPKDHPITYYQYDSNGRRGDTQFRDQGGNILCHNVVVTTTRADGTQSTVTYDKAYYDEEAKRFFLKVIDSYDAMEKPTSFTNDGNGCVKVSTFLPNTTVGEYEETIYEYEFYDLYDEYVDINGNKVKQLNPTYMYVVPTVVTNTYRLSSGGERELLSTNTERAEVGVYIRTASIDKLFSDTNKLLAGEPIDKMGLN